MLPPARAGERIIAREREHDARRIDALCGASDVLHDDDEGPNREHSTLPEHVEEELAHGERESGGEQVWNRRCGEGGGNVEQPAERGSRANADENRDRCGAGSVGCFFSNVSRGVVFLPRLMSV